jgi:hypothetical protein
MSRLILLSALALALVGGAQDCHAGVVTFLAHLTGPNESPPNGSPGVGDAIVDIDAVAHTMRVRVIFSGLVAGTTASHIHAPTPDPLSGTAGVATTIPTFPGFPLMVTSGSYDMTFNMTLASSYNPAFITASGGTTALAEARLFQAINEGRSYLNIHTTAFPNGEIRGFLINSTPEPSTLALLGSGAAALAGYTLRRRKAQLPA